MGVLLGSVPPVPPIDMTWVQGLGDAVGFVREVLGVGVWVVAAAFVTGCVFIACTSSKKRQAGLLMVISSLTAVVVLTALPTMMGWQHRERIGENPAGGILQHVRDTTEWERSVVRDEDGNLVWGWHGEGNAP